MKINNKNKMLIFALFAVLFCIFLGTFLYRYSIGDNVIKLQHKPNNESGFTYNDDFTVTLGLGMVAHGFYDTITNKIIDSGSLMKPVNGKINGQVSFQQNINEIRNYLLIILIDYKQYDFIVNDTTYSTYPFSLEGNEELRISVEISNLNSDAHEFTYYIIPEPNITDLSIDNSNEWNKLLMTSNIYSWRLLLNSLTKNANLSEYDNSYMKMASQTDYGIQLSKTHQEVAVMPTCKSMDDVELIISNPYNSDLEYAVIAFLNWEQIPLNNDIIKIVKIPSNTNIYYKIKVPTVDKNAPYQIFAIPNPYDNDINNSNPPSCTLRTIIMK